MYFVFWRNNIFFIAPRFLGFEEQFYFTEPDICDQLCTLWSEGNIQSKKSRIKEYTTEKKLKSAVGNFLWDFE